MDADAASLQIPEVKPPWLEKVRKVGDTCVMRLQVCDALRNKGAVYFQFPNGNGFG